MTSTCETCACKDLLSLDIRNRGLDIVACRSCGLVWNRNMAKESAQIQFYRHENRAGSRVRGSYLRSMLGRASGIVEFLGDDLQPGLRHLDVGCAEGTLLALTRSKGLVVQGLELDAKFSQFARKVRQLEVHETPLERGPLQSESFDLISFIHVLEHLVHPVRVLTAARRLLSQKGRLVVEVPNLNQPLPAARRFFRPKHNFYFSEQTLRIAVDSAGYSSFRTALSPRDSSLQLLATKNSAPAQATFNAGGRLDDESEWIETKVRSERNQHYLLIKLLFTRFLRQKSYERKALKTYGARIDL